ncbi:zinc metalloprotease HtpX [Sulfolobus acidocaldarius]|uniref:Protease HtpX homolog 1 n=4 Tax=Sulfolobus acidocaldarius TaxID=2285 RepID=HTPX1_SULAC|nr:zinc metalloprotease HtpX [Sulfolobus acidocaldarius]Q4JAE2.1 RecName: Full=Protease HtpX homolog 1 [Sulfolobus acidocaldarius DSM 639]AAY80237.1 conserved Prokaryal protein [Sulfolobus acidocaldarius DSM 639]AGE70817.1 hypothetical protein SacN8_04230 [Sulfolobus acidocaldarius N8]AGE73088.1 hypothetical protein SacRon12I_04220 [Sulfolobus acidocaldarius Ron12/I]ALU28866.1 protease [Sulfolobus acidocaldarius]ALU31588.1 protease [Sulfolobus acidocaldarius]
MNVGRKLKTLMFLSGTLTIIAEGIITYLIVSIIGIPTIFTAIFLVILWLIQWLIAPYLVGRNTEEVGPGDPLYEIVRKIAMESKVPTPRVFISYEEYPNAFAFGNYITGKRVAVTKPLLDILNQDELEAVLAHEVGHIKHLDVEIGMALGLIPTIIGYVGNFLLFTGWTLLFFAGDEVELILGLAMLAIGGVLFVLTFLLQIFVLWFNRLRESFADFHSATLYKDKAPYLATALAKIQIYAQNIRTDPFTGIIITAPPIKLKENERDAEELVMKWLHEHISPFADILMTHPHPAKRVKMLYSILQGT